MSDSTGSGKLLFVFEAAHQAREALLDVTARKRVMQVVRKTIESQWQLLNDESKSRLAAWEKHLAWRREGCKGKMPPMPGPNQGATNRVDDWPFPIEHGTDESPGCILLLAAINDYAVEHPEQFRKTSCKFRRLLPAKHSKSWGGGPWAIYGWSWVDAVANLTAGHEDRLMSSTDRALVELGGGAKGVAAEGKPINVEGFADDTAFIPTNLQGDILAALDGKAMKKQELADVVCGGEGTRLYKPGGVKELMVTEPKLVDRKSGVGYFRPDRPPEQSINLSELKGN